MSTLEYHFSPFERVQVRKNERNSKNDELGTCTRMIWRALVPFTGLVGLAIKQCLPIYNKGDGPIDRSPIDRSPFDRRPIDRKNVHSTEDQSTEKKSIRPKIFRFFY